MVRWSPEEYAAFKKRNTGGSGLCSTDAEPAKGNPLERSLPREGKGSAGPPVSPEPKGRSRILFTVYSVRPCDWDGYHVKELQDLLIKAGILDGDEWNLLQGEVISEKVYSKEEERTEITITPP